MSEHDKAFARVLEESRVHDYTSSGTGSHIESRVGEDEKPDDDGMRMLSMIPVIGVLTIAGGWALYRGVLWLAERLAAVAR